MAFDPKKLPPAVYATFQQGPMAWALVVEKAIVAKIHDLNKLTDIVFYLHYPERIGKPLKPHESALINKWKGFRALIKPRHEQMMRIGRSSGTTDHMDAPFASLDRSDDSWW